MQGIHTSQRGFTLMEMSIVLVIIGFIAAGILVGKELISAARVRAQITQIEKYNTAVHTFQVKYNCLPGDCTNAATFGFQARGGSRGCGDGNGTLESNYGSYGTQQGSGEQVIFWMDLSQANLIEGKFSSEFGTNCPALGIPNPNDFSMFFPVAKIGQGNYVYVWSANNINYFALANVFTSGAHGWNLQAQMSLTVQQAYALDTKVDDGSPQTGNVTAQYTAWSAMQWSGASDTSATSGSSTTCYDNGNTAGATQQYSLAQNNGAGENCALSFRFQ